MKKDKDKDVNLVFEKPLFFDDYLNLKEISVNFLKEIFIFDNKRFDGMFVYIQNDYLIFDFFGDSRFFYLKDLKEFGASFFKTGVSFNFVSNSGFHAFIRFNLDDTQKHGVLIDSFVFKDLFWFKFI